MIKANIRMDLAGFDESLGEIQKIIDANCSEVADLVTKVAQTTSAFSDKTGTLRGSIRKKKSKFENGGYVVESKAPHAHLIEYGHVKIAWGHVTGGRVPAHPFMRPAKEQGIRLAVSLFGSK